MDFELFFLHLNDFMNFCIRDEFKFSHLIDCSEDVYGIFFYLCMEFISSPIVSAFHETIHKWFHFIFSFNEFNYIVLFGENTFEKSGFQFIFISQANQLSFVCAQAQTCRKDEWLLRMKLIVWKITWNFEEKFTFLYMKLPPLYHRLFCIDRTLLLC